jgi:hypothetical protein
MPPSDRRVFIACALALRSWRGLQLTLPLTLLALSPVPSPPVWPQPNPSGGCPLARKLEVIPPSADRGSGPRSPVIPPPDTDGDYRHQLNGTAHGWPRRDHWCVWVEPASTDGPAGRWDQAWLEAVETALASWAELVPIERVSEPDQAQVRILRRRPPLRGGRASHGRAELQLVVVDEPGPRHLQPRVVVLISPGQRSSAIQATALHELGHAFGLWGHSDGPGDAMTAIPGPTPILELSPRDRATFRWLQQQPGLGPAPPVAP